MALKVVAVLVHGTFARNAPWTREDSALCNALRERFGSGLVIERFLWSGANSYKERADAATELSARLDELATIYEAAQIVVVAHSHGGNVATYALATCKSRSRVVAFVTLATPFVALDPRRIDIGVQLIGWGLTVLGLIATAAAFSRWIVNPVIDCVSRPT